MALSQSLQQKLLQKLSPQQIQLMKLLQVPTANLEERIKEELEENPALEQTEEDYDDAYDEPKDEFESSSDDEYDTEGSEEEYDNIDLMPMTTARLPTIKCATIIIPKPAKKIKQFLTAYKLPFTSTCRSNSGCLS
jgi:DNA-directed RNA polymerase specialized sigma54-like protein